MGRPKAWLPFHEEPLLQRMVRLLGAEADPIVVVAASGQDLPPLPNQVAVAHDAEEGLGPMQGLVSGLAVLAQIAPEAEAAYITGCDSPFLAPGWVRRLGECLGEHAIAAPLIGGRRHPLAAVYRPAVARIATRLLGEGQRSMTALLEQSDTRLVQAKELADIDADFLTVRNVNTPRDYESALRAEP
jgi:molybdopterin-guanine dinucleotide biosynthesis protein A